MSGRVLIVEDDFLLATDLAERLEQDGFDVLGPCNSVRSAMDTLQETPCDIAVLDINLGHETTEPLALHLKSTRTPFVIASGHLEGGKSEAYSEAPTLSKPVKMDRLVSILLEIVAK